MIWKTIATFFGIGYLPYFPGTIGTLAGLVVFCLLGSDPRFQAAGVAVTIVAGFWSAGRMAAYLKEEDPRPVVIDEVAGILLGLLFLPVRWPVLLAGFLIFRFLDILKPFGIRRLEDLPGGWGIMMDDLAAGLLTNLALRVSLFLL